MSVWLADAVAAGFVLRGLLEPFLGGVEAEMAATDYQRRLVRRIAILKVHVALGWIATGAAIAIATRCH